MRSRVRARRSLQMGMGGGCGGGGGAGPRPAEADLEGTEEEEGEEEEEEAASLEPREPRPEPEPEPGPAAPGAALRWLLHAGTICQSERERLRESEVVGGVPVMDGSCVTDQMDDTPSAGTCDILWRVQVVRAHHISPPPKSVRDRKAGRQAGPPPRRFRHCPSQIPIMFTTWTPTLPVLSQGPCANAQS